VAEPVAVNTATGEILDDVSDQTHAASGTP
jgi:hypothetical protein